MTALYMVNPYVRATDYAQAHFIHDVRVAGSPLVEVPAQRVTQDEFAAFELLTRRGFMIEPRSADEIREYLSDNELGQEHVETMLDRRVLKPYSPPGYEIEQRVLDHFNRRFGSEREVARNDAGAYDPSFDLTHSTFAENTFFNVPKEVAAEASHVGFLGLPQASLNVSWGTQLGPDQLRLQSRAHSWLDISRNGAYSEVTFDGSRPQVIGEGVVVRDCGDLRTDSMTLKEMFDAIETRLTRDFFTPGVYPLIVGGDHAITYPVVKAHLQHIPDLGLIHLDAHNDLFYTPHIVHSHAAPVSNLFRAARISRVASYGLRTFTDTRMAGIRAVYGEPDADARLHLRSIATTKQLIMNPRDLETELRGLADRPYYVTLDLDVLSDGAMGRQVSTPFGSGLEWHELFTFLVAVFEYVDVVGFDIVEYNAMSGQNSAQYRYYLNSLLMIVVDRLARANPKFRPQEDGRPSLQEA